MTFGKWLRAIAIAGALLLGASFGFSRALRASAARRYLIAHLAASFGRPVEVSWFDFNLLDGARIEAHFVSVGEDPHFGNEYFLRADTLTAGLRWRALLAGRFEFGSISLSRPSLNLVRDTDGHWNLERWLPPAPPAGLRPASTGSAGPPRDVRAARLSRIDVDGGRVNFKLQDSKIPFALVGVSGRVEQDGSGHWQLDVEARPMRAGVELQDIGTLRLRGRVGGTTARLQPAEIHVTWRAASLADALRLAREKDYGIRGGLAVDLDARVAPPDTSEVRSSDSTGAQWAIAGVARLTGIHGWGLTERTTDPAVNLALETTWRLGEAHAQIRTFLIELPASRLQGDGDLEWSHGFHPQLRVAPSTIALEDVLSWYRALRPGVAEDLRAHGVLGLDLFLGGWPIQLQQGAITSAGATIALKSSASLLRVGAVRAGISHGGIELSPTEVSVAPGPAPVASAENVAAHSTHQSFAVRATILPESNGVFRWPPNWSISVEGSTSRAQDWLALAHALGQGKSSGWTAEGGLSAKLRGVRRSDAPAAPWTGSVDAIGLTLNLAYLNRPINLPKAHWEMGPVQQTITLSGAEAFGAVWRGSITRKGSDSQSSFDLSADHIDIAELDRWLGPRARPGFLARIVGLGLQSAQAQTLPADAIITRMTASGRLRADEIDLSSLRLEKFDGQAEIVGRTIRIRNGQADFSGGKVSGAFSADLQPEPSYGFRGQFERVNLSQLGRGVTFLNDRIGGSISAVVSLSTHGIGRDKLIASLEGEGTINGRNIELRGLDLSNVFSSQLSGSDPPLFQSVQGTYRIRSRGVDLANLVLDYSRERLEAEGRIDFDHTLKIRIRPAIFLTQAAAGPVSASPPSFSLGGTIESPKFVLPSVPASETANAGARGK